MVLYPQIDYRLSIDLTTVNEFCLNLCQLVFVVNAIENVEICLYDE